MVVEIGHFALILSLALALLLSVLPLYGATKNNLVLMNSARPLSWGMFVLLALSFTVLLWAFYTNDFTLKYVAANSNSQLPWYYRLTAVWGAHEGALYYYGYLFKQVGQWLLPLLAGECRRNQWRGF